VAQDERLQSSWYNPAPNYCTRIVNQFIVYTLRMRSDGKVSLLDDKPMCLPLECEGEKACRIILRSVQTPSARCCSRGVEVRVQSVGINHQNGSIVVR
jgi:hypothetical protein